MDTSTGHIGFRCVIRPTVDDPRLMAEVRGEPRWPMTLAVVIVIILISLLPERLSPLPTWVFPSVLTILLIALIATDPGAITKTARRLRWLSLALVIMLAVAALSATTLMIRDLIEGSPLTANATTLLATGASVWVINIVAFALLYWEFDCGGPAARAHGMPPSPDLAFPQQLNAEVAPPEWRPRFVDYLYVGITDAVAFSPTDAMPLVPWAKFAMAIEAVISLAILGLVIARAVNVFT
jgi:hypothetical protein